MEKEKARERTTKIIELDRPLHEMARLAAGITGKRPGFGIRLNRAENWLENNSAWLRQMDRRLKDIEKEYFAQRVLDFILGAVSAMAVLLAAWKTI